MKAFILVLSLVGCGPEIETELPPLPDMRADVCAITAMAWCDRAHTCEPDYPINLCIADFVAGCCELAESCKEATEVIEDELYACLEDLYTLSCSLLGDAFVPVTCRGLLSDSAGAYTGMEVAR